jgi:hypothetical protein
MFADLCRDVQRCLKWGNGWGVDNGTASIDVKIVHAERQHRVICLVLNAPEGIMKQRRCSLNFRERKAVEWPGGDMNAPN